MTVFSEKLRTIPGTISLVARADIRSLADALREGGHRVAFAIGSGGSAVCAEYLARCRSTLGFAPTIVQTPMELVLAGGDLRDCEVWLFSAGADNPDIAGALRAALLTNAAAVRLLTVRGDGATGAKAAAHPRCDVHVLPVAELKDGFLATHSMAATVSALLFASNALGGTEPASLRDGFAVRATEALAEREPDWPGGALPRLQRGDTLLILHDPQCRAVGVLIETSLWETGMCSVQRTDFRNFAHGRHVWIAKRLASTVLLSLTASETRTTWAALEELLPAGLRRMAVDLGDAGRHRTAVGLMQGLAVIRAIGNDTAIDPGRPGVGDLAKPIYDDPSLDQLSRQLTPAVRHKRDAVLRHDPLDGGVGSACVMGRGRLDSLFGTDFRAVVLDYDGTIVPTESRLLPPSSHILNQIVRLVDGGIAIGIATGRGGSAGEALREHLPKRVHALLTVGYYNGGHIRPLDVDIAVDRPAQDQDVLEAAHWIDRRGLLTPGRKPKPGPVQLMLGHDDLTDPRSFPSDVAGCPPVADGRLRVLRSHHSFDLIPRTTSKNAVVRAVAVRAGDADACVLRIGDSGGNGENDQELLSGLHGISVDSVCGSLAGSWSLFGGALTGPAALLRILSSMRIGSGVGRLDLAPRWLSE